MERIAGLPTSLKRAGFPVAGDARCRHERISAKFINKLIKERVGSFTADAISRSVVVHHGYWIEAARDISAGIRGNAISALPNVAAGARRQKRSPASLRQTSARSELRLAGHIVLCDWIASNEKFFGDDRLKGINEPEAYFARAREIGREWVDRLGLGRGRQAGEAVRIVETARPIQQTLLDTDIPPGLVIPPGHERSGVSL